MSEMRIPFAQPVQAVLVCDEEISSPTGRDAVMAAAANAAAVLGLEPPHPSGDLKNGRRGVARVRLEVEGRESHAGLAAADGVSAIDELIDQLVRLRSGLAGQPDVSCNVGHITGGTRANVVAGAGPGPAAAPAPPSRRTVRALPSRPPESKRPQSWTTTSGTRKPSRASRFHQPAAARASAAVAGRTCEKISVASCRRSSLSARSSSPATP